MIDLCRAMIYTGDNIIRNMQLDLFDNTNIHPPDRLLYLLHRLNKSAKVNRALYRTKEIVLSHLVANYDYSGEYHSTVYNNNMYGICESMYFICYTFVSDEGNTYKYHRRAYNIPSDAEVISLGIGWRSPVGDVATEDELAEIDSIANSIVSQRNLVHRADDYCCVIPHCNDEGQSVFPFFDFVIMRAATKICKYARRIRFLRQEKPKSWQIEIENLKELTKKRMGEADILRCYDVQAYINEIQTEQVG